MREVPATEFTRNFGRYREIARREPVAVTSHGRVPGQPGRRRSLA
jgi:hypothetical protein